MPPSAISPRTGSITLREASASRRRVASATMRFESDMRMLRSTYVLSSRVGRGVHGGEARDPLGNLAVVIERGAVRAIGGQCAERCNPRADLVRRLAAVARDGGVGHAVHRGQLARFEAREKSAVPLGIERMQMAVASR